MLLERVVYSLEIQLSGHYVLLFPGYDERKICTHKIGLECRKFQLIFMLDVPFFTCERNHLTWIYGSGFTRCLFRRSELV